MEKLLIKNIKNLVQIRDENNCPDKILGHDMAHLPQLENAWLAIENGIIADFGKMDTWPGISDWRNLKVIDADGKTVLPTWVDPHTHLVFAASREEEFVAKINGATYQEIAEKGGGILNSAKKLANMPQEILFEQAKTRLFNLIKLGTGAIEIKSGYGLTVDAELKMLRVIKQLKAISPIPIKATFLGAHAYPEEFKNNKQQYISLIINKMLPTIADEGLADYVDAFLEKNYFEIFEVEQILEAAAKYQLIPKVHVNQFNAFGGVKACVKAGARSVDHLEVMTTDDIEVLKNSNSMPTILPSCSFFLGIPYAPARQIIKNGLPVALASDFNPGSTPSGNMNFVVSLACIKNKMTPEEAINAATLNAAYAINLENKLGSITIGKKANLIITKPIPSIAYLPYSFGENLIDDVLINGQSII